MTDTTLYEIAGIRQEDAIAAAELKLMLHGAPGDTGCRIEHNGNYLWFSSSYGRQHLVGISPTTSAFMGGRECYPSKDLFDQKWPSDVITRRVAVAAMSPKLGMDWDTASFAWRRRGVDGKGVVVARIVRRDGVMWLEQADRTAETLEAAGGAGIWRTCPEKHAEGLDMEFISGKDTYGNYRFMCMRAGIRMRNKTKGAEKAAKAQTDALAKVPVRRGERYAIYPIGNTWRLGKVVTMRPDGAPDTILHLQSNGEPDDCPNGAEMVPAEHTGAAASLFSQDMNLWRSKLELTDRLASGEK